MENTMVLPQAGEWTLRRAEGPRDFGNMETTAVSPRISERTAKQAYSLEETQKGKIRMKRNTNVTAYRSLGWLIIIPIRLAAGIACLPLLTASTLLAMLYVLILGCCIALFCLRCRGFRTAYVGLAALGLVLGIAALPGSVIYLIAQALVEGILIPVLYRSKRIKETFFNCSREGAHAVDGWNSHRREYCCYDALMATYRITR